MNDEEEKIINQTILNPGLAQPIAVSKEEAIAKAHEQAQETKGTDNVKFAEIQHVTQEDLDEQRVNEVNDLMKNDYVKLVDAKYSKKTYFILFGVLAFIIVLIIIEVILFTR
ncbi:MAG: hypothetical protein J1F35_01735 [Erysipelotrichales bacterium]|nr:hypothetical protein [Erysipelotrichales bacterium]